MTREAAQELAAVSLGTERARLLLHPDYSILGDTKSDEQKSGTPSIGEARELKRHLALTAALGGRKVAIVLRAELLSQEAASAFLKLLELNMSIFQFI